MLKKNLIIFLSLCVIQVSLVAMQKSDEQQVEIHQSRTEKITSLLTELQCHNSSLLQDRSLTVARQKKIIKSVTAISEIMALISSLPDNTDNILHCIKQSKRSILLSSEHNISQEFLEKQTAIYNKLFESIQ
jgi:hypothetical protein